MEPANFAELRTKIDSWDISAEELLLQKMKIFTINYNEEFQQFCKNMDNFSNNIEDVELEHLKAINQIKTISRDQFIENALDKGEESESESVSNDNNIKEPVEIQITNIEKMKNTIEVSLNCLEEISRKNKNKEEIEDDAASVVSSKIMMDKGAKVRLPFVIGTQEFKADKHIGLNVAPENDEEDEKEKEKKENEEESEEDSDVEEILADIKVDEKQRKKWERVKKKKEEKKQKLKQKLLASKTFSNNVPKNEEPEVKVPIENEGQNQNNENVPNDPNAAVVVYSADPAKSGGAVPPPLLPRPHPR